MEKELVNIKTGDVTEVAVRKIELTKEQVDLLQRTVCQDHTADEIQLFIQYCQAKGMDPFGREIYSIKRKGRVTFQIGIDALRMKAEETGEYNGQETAWCDSDGKWVDVWVSRMPPFAAKVSVFRTGVDKPFVGIALWTEYKPAENDFIWQKMPSNQLAKCAEAIALRKAFPRKLGGLYASEEMEQADKGPAKTKIAMPKAKEKDPEVGMLYETQFRDEVVVDTHEIEFSEPPVGYKTETEAAIDVQAPMPKSKEEVEKAIRPPASKFFAALHSAVRKAGISEEKMKKLIKDSFKKDSSKDLNDNEASTLIKMIQSGLIK